MTRLTRKAVKMRNNKKYLEFTQKLDSIGKTISDLEDQIQSATEEMHKNMIKDGKELLTILKLKNLFHIGVNSYNTLFSHTLSNGDIRLVDKYGEALVKEVLSLIERVPFEDFELLKKKAALLREDFDEVDKKRKEREKANKQIEKRDAKDIANLLSTDGDIRRQVFKILAKD